MSNVTLVNVYRTRVLNSRYIFSNGTVATFIGDQYVTDSPSEIAELDAQIAQRHPAIYQNAGEVGIDKTSLDPVEVFKKKIIAEYLASLATAANPANDRGTSEAQNPQAGVASTVSIAPLTIGGSSLAALAAQQLPQIPQVPQAVSTQLAPQQAQQPAGNLPVGLANALGLIPVPQDVVPVPNGTVMENPGGDSAAKALSVFTAQGGAVSFPVPQQ